MKQSLRQKLIDKFQSRYRSGKDDPVHSQVIADWAHENLGVKNDTASRTLRILAEEGKEIKAIYKPMKNSKKETVWYQYVPNERDLLVRQLKS